MSSLSRQFKFLLLLFVVSVSQMVFAQTFRGGIAGTVQDGSGAVVSGAKITVTGTDTGFVRTMESTSAGDYSFQDLPLGVYMVEVSGAGFQPEKIDKISVRPGQVYSLDIKLGIASTNTQIEVSAASVSLDTVSSHQ